MNDLDSDNDKNITAAEFANGTAKSLDKSCRDLAMLDQRQWLLKPKDKTTSFFSLIDSDKDGNFTKADAHFLLGVWHVEFPTR